MADLKFYVSNKSYGEAWLEKMKDSGHAHYSVIKAILAAIKKNDGGDIRQSDVFEESKDVENYVTSQKFSIIPSRGQELGHNGKGIRHVKFSPSKNIALLWERIGDTIFYTFDDHSPVRFHRAIYCLKELRLGKEPFPLKCRTPRRVMKKIWKKGYRKNKGIDPRRRHYK